MVTQKIIAVVGPTASGKSALALKLIKNLNITSEIISADAFQVYEELNIGVNKPTAEELKITKHHLINCCKINESWNIKKFQDLAKLILKELDSKKIVPIICGGSHLYIDALLNDYTLVDDSSLIKVNNDFTNEELFNQLYSLDQAEAIKITVHNRRRLIRAIEICKNSGMKKSQKDQNKFAVYNVLYIFCNPSRDYLYDQINKRVELMIKMGWVHEVETLLEKYPNFLLTQACKAIGYNYLANCIQKNNYIDLEEIKKMTRHLAKRQITWCKNHYTNNVIYFNFSEDNFCDLKNQIQLFLKN